MTTSMSHWYGFLWINSAAARKTSPAHLARPKSGCDSRVDSAKWQHDDNRI